MIRIVLFIVVFGILFFIVNLIINSLGPTQCDYCEGKGYWRETRGEKNRCTVCNGTGQLENSK